MPDRTRDVAVLGAGITGLTTAWHLHQAGADVVLIEADEHVGGYTCTERRDGWLLEKGPFNVIIRDPAFEDLLGALAGEVEVVTASKSARKRYIYRNGRIQVVPTNPISLLTTPLLSFGARLRLIRGLFWSTPAGPTEETIEQVATRRFGKEVSDTMVSAVIAGIFAGDIRKLSLEACFTTIGRIDREAKSLFFYGLSGGFNRKGDDGELRRKRRWRGLVSLDGGLGALSEALARPLGEDCRVCCRAEAVRETEAGFEIDITSNQGSEQIRCRRLVLALPLEETARLLKPIMPEVSEILGSIESAPMVVLNLGFRRVDVGHALDGFGYLAPHNEPHHPLMGVLWADSIFPHHAPADYRLLRVFIGGSRDPEAVRRSNDELLSLAMGELRSLLQIRGEPTMMDICRYPAAIPQYNLGHRRKIEAILEAVRRKPGLHLAGNYLEGVSLNDCIRCGTRVARTLTQSSRSSAGIAPAESAASRPDEQCEVLTSRKGSQS